MTCDVCSQHIGDAKMTNLAWSGSSITSEQPSTTNVMLLNQVPSTRAADAATGEHLNTQELTVSLYRLLANAGITTPDLEAARGQHALLGGLA